MEGRGRKGKRREGRNGRGCRKGRGEREGSVGKHLGVGGGITGGEGEGKEEQECWGGGSGIQEGGYVEEGGAGGVSSWEHELRLSCVSTECLDRQD